MLYIFLFILGLAIGSFLNVLIDRLPKEESITGRSHCDYCKKKLTWLDLIPILSFLYLGGRCRYCGKKLSYFYPFVELVTGISFVLIGLYLGNKGSIENQALQLVALLGIVSCSIVVFFSDFKYQIIPDSIQIGLFIFSAIEKITVIKVITVINVIEVLKEGLSGGLVVMLPILLLFLVTKTKGMGFGDVKLAFTIGFLLGFLNGFAALYIGFIIGAVVGLCLILLGRKKMKSKIAFGPFLVLGLLIMLIWGDQVFSLIDKI